MIHKDAKFIGSIPANYDCLLGPVLFEPFALDLASRLKLNENEKVLELACGTGILTKALTRYLPPSSHLFATDLNEPMLDYARTKLIGVSGITWSVVDAARLNFPANSFDVVVSQFGLMFVPDKLTALKAIYNVLRSGGVFLFNVWDKLELNSFQRITNDAMHRLFPVDPPTFYEIPFSLCNKNLLADLLRSAGFSDFESESLTKATQSNSARELATGLIYGNPLITAIRERLGLPPEVVVSELEHDIIRECGSAPARGNMQAIIVKATK